MVDDTVNSPSRLEYFEKDLFDWDLAETTCRILIGETTLRYLDRQFKTKIGGNANLKGNAEKVTVYRVVGRVEKGE